MPNPICPIDTIALTQVFTTSLETVALDLGAAVQDAENLLYVPFKQHLASRTVVGL